MRRIINYFEHFLVFIFAISGCVWIYAFASLAGVFGIFASSSVVLKMCALIEGIKKYNLSSKKKRKKHDSTVLLAKIDSILNMKNFTCK